MRISDWSSDVCSSDLVAFFLLVNYVKLVPYTGLGLFTMENLATSAALFPVAVAGMLAGIWLHDRVPTGLFYAACYLFLALTGVKLVYDGLAEQGCSSQWPLVHRSACALARAAPRGD